MIKGFILISSNNIQVRPEKGTEFKQRIEVTAAGGVLFHSFGFDETKESFTGKAVRTIHKNIGPEEAQKLLEIFEAIPKEQDRIPDAGRWNLHLCEEFRTHVRNGSINDSTVTVNGKEYHLTKLLEETLGIEDIIGM